MSERFNDGIIDLSQFREKKEQEEVAPSKPFFSEPHQFQFEESDGTPVYYVLHMNLVFNGKQVLVIERTEDDKGTGEIGIVEAVIQNDEFHGVKGIESEEEFKELTDLISTYLSNESEGEPDGDDD